MIIYDNTNKEGLKINLQFDKPETAVTEIANMIVDVVLGTCHLYLNDNKQMELLEIISEVAKGKMKLVKK